MSPNFSAGARLGRYEIKSQLGAGGMGELYLAEDTRLHRRVALTILPAELTRTKTDYVGLDRSRCGGGTQSSEPRARL